MGWSRRSTLVLGFALATLAAHGAGCTLDRDGRAEPANQGGQMTMACETDLDCGAEPECQVPKCNDGTCEFEAKSLGIACGNLQDRKCDGKGVCVDCIGPGDCAGGTCVDAVKEGGETCEQGQCVANASTECAPYGCNAAGDNCAADCATNGVNDCTPGLLCNRDDVCVVSYENGHPCATGQCTSGFCVDGVCCDTVCDRACTQCIESATTVPDGTCASVAPFTDPKDMCVAELGCGDGNCATCGFIPDAPGAATCPAECTGGCTMSSPFICTITCEDGGATPCDGVTVDCPAGWHCLVDCIDSHACRDARINCPEDYECRVDCADAGHACQRMDMRCSQFGLCEVDCMGGNTCQDATVDCHLNACTGQCDGSNAPIFNDPDGACLFDCQ